MPVAMTTNGGSICYLTCDQVGSLRIVTDISGTVVRKLDYDSFGNLLLPENNPSFQIPFGFAGGLYDRDTGLVRFGYRDYDPDVGRWTAKYPIFFKGGDTDIYGYCLSDPVNWIDSDGLAEEHTSNKQPSNKPKHEKGKKRKKMDKGGEKGDSSGGVNGLLLVLEQLFLV